MSLLRHGCQRHSLFKFSYWQSNVHFSDQMSWQFVQICLDSQLQSKLRVLDTDDLKQRCSLFSVQGKSACYCFMVYIFILCLLCPVYKINAQTWSQPSSPPIYYMNLSWTYSAVWIDLIGNPISFCRFFFLKQYSANGTCLMSNFGEYVTSLSLLWKS